MGTIVSLAVVIVMAGHPLSRGIKGCVSSQHPVPSVEVSAVGHETEQMCPHNVGPMAGVEVL